jgi:cellulose synthase/poly-beta-1,6-N-acetylglucosamine synthase-like glycosyltransferase
LITAAVLEPAMDVKTVDEASFSYRTVLVYSLVTALICAVVVAPVFVSTPYGRLLNTVMLVALFGLVIRTVVSSVITFAHVNTPTLPEDPDLPEVSVVIPAYNEAPVLEGTIEACRNLDYPEERLEVVLCYEAASVDGTCAMAERLAAEDDITRAVKRDEPGGGKAKATNYALRYATGDVIASIDADHEFEPRAVRRAVAWFLDDEDTWCVKGRCFGRNPTDSVIALHATVERHLAEKGEITARELYGGYTFFGGGQAFFRAELFDELGLFDEQIMVEDIDMSSKIHEAGKDLHVDPSVITYEENPATLDAWWSQRKRWARGWMQVANRYLTRVPGTSTLSLGQRLDGIYTMLYAIVPALLVLAMPMGVLSALTSVSAPTYIPLSDSTLWTVPFFAPGAVFGLIALQDYRDGLSHNPAEYLAALTLGPYLILQTAVYVTAFIQEYLFRKQSVYVTTSRSDG